MSPSLGEGEPRTGTTGFSTPLPYPAPTDAFTVVNTAPFGPWADAPVEGSCSPRAVPGDSPYAPGGAKTKNGVGRLPREETADAVVKEKGLRPW